MSKPAPPCRLSVILAREAPVGVIFRRGPAKWFHGRIYERRSDLSRLAGGRPRNSLT